jgi:hypothetical protein
MLAPKRQTLTRQNASQRNLLLGTLREHQQLDDQYHGVAAATLALRTVSKMPLNLITTWTHYSFRSESQMARTGCTNVHPSTGENETAR